jgi:pilus assembly protein CpaE
MNDKIKVIVNHCEGRSIINTKNIQNVLDVKDIAFITNNAKLVSESVAMGIPFIINKPREKISKDISSLANELYNSRKAK